MLSKPSIVTENCTVHDYIENKKNGMIIEKTKNALKTALDYLNNPQSYKEMCLKARNDYINNFSQYSLGVDIGEMLINSRA